MKRQPLYLMKVCLVLLLSVTIFCDFIYADGVSNWARPCVDEALEMGIVPFDLKPFTRPITRREFCYILNNSILDRLNFNHEQLQEYYAFNADDYNYVDTDDFQVRISTGMGLVKGVSEYYFKPENTLTRQEAATIISRLFIILNFQNPGIEDTATVHPYLDRARIAPWAVKFVDYMSDYGIIKGYSNGNFGPNDSYTIEQAVVTVMRAVFGKE